MLNKRVIQQAAKTIHKLSLIDNDDNPMDGDEVDDICEVFKKELNELNGNT